ncbi:MAG: hypothetical protein ACRC35_09825 [Angustibacter sp.]
MWRFVQRLNGAGDPVGSWALAGTVCDADAVRAARDRAPVVTVGMIERAARELPFARPGFDTAPLGRVTLVNLPTYFVTRWPEAGLEPDEATTVTLLGRSIRIRPVAASYTYVYGDGQSKKTDSPGGYYPDGDVLHTYLDKGSMRARVVCSYAAQYQVSPAHPWQDIDITVPITGPVATARVKEATNRLIGEPEWTIQPAP